MKITSYPAHTSTTLAAADVFLTDGVKGTKKIMKSDLTFALFEDIPEMHKCIYRGKQIGTTLSSAQASEIAAGTYHDIWIGDYWLSANVKWTVVDFDYYSAMGVPQPHIIVMPMSQIGNDVIDNSSRGTIQGFADCSLLGALDTTYKNAFASVFGSTHLIERDMRISSGWWQGTPTNGRPIGYSTNTTSVRTAIMIPSEIQFFGTKINSTIYPGGSGNYTDGYRQFKMFNMGIYPPPNISLWFRDQTWDRSFAAYIPTHNQVDDRNVSNAAGVMPYAIVG